jgi:hypothetical protein
MTERKTKIKPPALPDNHYYKIGSVEVLRSDLVKIIAGLTTGASFCLPNIGGIIMGIGAAGMVASASLLEKEANQFIMEREDVLSLLVLESNSDRILTKEEIIQACEDARKGRVQRIRFNSR